MQQPGSDASLPGGKGCAAVSALQNENGLAHKSQQTKILEQVLHGGHRASMLKSDKDKLALAISTLRKEDQIIGVFTEKKPEKSTLLKIFAR